MYFQRFSIHEKNITHRSTGGNVANTSIGGDSEVNQDISESGFRRFVMKPLTALSMQVKDLHKKIDKLITAKSFSIEQRNDEETSEDEFEKFPLIQSQSDLIAFERKLKNQSFYSRIESYKSGAVASQCRKRFSSHTDEISKNDAH
ncbi:hypothetical protein PV327_011370 [Microctonus hyperodae]|uniref:Uncharacterized protein n=1 Tax=Microctonus hyperodae TaxID=165561 RepID=A0AA39C3E4_MICHY|nr:hypothetical protein PV327_011370 [Microctonus hyperodae]